MELTSPFPNSPALALLSKQGLAITTLARALLGAAPGERILSVQAFASQIDASVGTVQAALDYLQDTGAAKLEARGRLGTFASQLNYPMLWGLALHRAVIGALPLPYSLRFEGLATGSRQQFEAAQVELSLRFMRGALQRLEALVTGVCDWALVSRFAAETAEAHGFSIDTILLLGSDTYLAGHTLLARADAPAQGARLGIDYESIDHAFLVRAVARSMAAELIEIEYSQGLALIHAGTIDATVWSAEDLPATLGDLRVSTLEPALTPVLARLSEAAIVVNRGNRIATNLLGAAVNHDSLLQVQREVVNHLRLPDY
jgi:hypothetical protein